MREIRFRAWDRATKKRWVPGPEERMFYFGLANVPEYIGNTFCPSGGDRFVPRFTVMQYTGLKDKNGEAIYEGDIVLRVHSKYDPPWLEPEMLQIVWHPETASFVCADVHGGCCPMGEDEWRVVGNVHENPELLEGGGFGDY